MIVIDWSLLSFGMVTGTAASALFFAGLALGMRIALGAARPAAILLLSAALRINMLLGMGWWIAQAGPWAFGGFALAFFLVRFVAINVVRPHAQPQSEKGGVGWK